MSGLGLAGLGRGLGLGLVVVGGQAGAANQVQKRTLSANATLGWIRLVGTIVTGPALVAGTAAFRTPHAG